MAVVSQYVQRESALWRGRASLPLKDKERCCGMCLVARTERVWGQGEGQTHIQTSVMYSGMDGG